MGNGQYKRKPRMEEWVEAAEVLADRLTECVHTYKHNTYIFMAEAERQHKTDLVIKILQKLHAALDESDNPTASGNRVVEKRLVDSFVSLFTEALKVLPWISVDMQKLLKSPWMKGFPGKVSESLFWGNGEERKGIGSGLPEHGRLPEWLTDIMDREEVGEVRPARSETGEPSRKDKEAADRWHEQNAGFLRTAGRVE
ncbi:MAG: hypothetical protein PHE27_00210 [Alphaproteobacteria bacterium]|nr:hypothetical protein [Alphaproteobacteria bacterium]